MAEMWVGGKAASLAGLLASKLVACSVVVMVAGKVALKADCWAATTASLWVEKKVVKTAAGKVGEMVAQKVALRVAS